MEDENYDPDYRCCDNCQQTSLPTGKRYCGHDTLFLTPINLRGCFLWVSISSFKKSSSMGFTPPTLSKNFSFTTRKIAKPAICFQLYIYSSCHAPKGKCGLSLGKHERDGNLTHRFSLRNEYVRNEKLAPDTHGMAVVLPVSALDRNPSLISITKRLFNG